MIEANFSESQLQQLINTEITMRLYQSGRGMFLPVVISLPEEAIAGWDTGFFFPWLGMPGTDDHRGCNFFIQFKLAMFLEGRRSGEWSFWGQPYFRFRIPHKSKDKITRAYFDDYHQLDALRSLAMRGYPVYYGANRTCYESDLFASAAAQTLLDTQAFIRLQGTTRTHKYVTYTAHASRCYMHSTPDEIPLSGWEDMLGDSVVAEATRLSQTVSELEVLVRAAEERRGTPERLRMDAMYERATDGQRRLSWTARAAIVATRLRQEVNTYWFRHRDAE